MMQMEPLKKSKAIKLEALSGIMLAAMEGKIKAVKKARSLTLVKLFRNPIESIFGIFFKIFAF